MLNCEKSCHEDKTDNLCSVHCTQSTKYSSTQTIVQLIGKRCTVSCFINGEPIELLLGSEVQVIMVSKAWLESAFPHLEIQLLQPLFANQSIEISATNGTTVPLDGWVETPDLQ